MLITYNLDNMESVLMDENDSVLLAPCTLTCGRLMIVHGMLVLVEGIRNLKDTGFRNQLEWIRFLSVFHL